MRSLSRGYVRCIDGVERLHVVRRRDIQHCDRSDSGHDLCNMRSRHLCIIDGVYGVHRLRSRHLRGIDGVECVHVVRSRDIQRCDRSDGVDNLCAMRSRHLRVVGILYVHHVRSRHLHVNTGVVSVHRLSRGEVPERRIIGRYNA
jgi:hypothetical protein